MACAAQAQADTLYVAAPPPAAPGHPLRLGPDRKASQVGDLVAVQFNFSTATSRAYSSQTAKGYNVNQGAGSGLFGLPLIRIGGAVTGQTSSNASDSKTDASTFSSAMMATVTNILPSGALQVEGDQELLINGERQKLHVVGYARPEDIDNFDTIPSTRLANVHADFVGNDTKEHKSVLRKILDALF
ncbi:MAG: flagellar basal body L-ring protein FlgH [Candidatus Velthaea sp.]